MWQCGYNMMFIRDKFKKKKKNALQVSFNIWSGWTGEGAVFKQISQIHPCLPLVDRTDSPVPNSLIVSGFVLLVR